MKIRIRGTLETDGDFRVDNCEKIGVEFDGYEGYKFDKVFDINSIENKLWALTPEDYLIKIWYNIHIIDTHDYLIIDIGRLFLEAIDALNGNISKLRQGFHKAIYGNYEGTEIFIDIID